jgi:hypothetical protein
VWPRWRLFLHTLFELPADPTTPDAQFIPHRLHTFQVVHLLSLFAYYMFSTLALSAARVVHQLTALRYMFLIRGGDIESFASPHVSAVRRGLLNQPPHTDRAVTVARRRLPVTLEMVLYIYNRVHNPLTLERLARRAAIILAFCCLFRPSEYLWGTRSNRHVLTAAQVEFEISTPGSSTTFWRSMAEMQGITWAQVRLMRIHMHTAKNIKRRAGARLWFSATATNPLSVVRVMFDWALQSSPISTAPIFSWPSPTQPNIRDNLWYREFHNDIRAAAAHFGFDSSQFGCHGIRVGGATLLRAAGADDGFICLMGRWASLPACLSYQETSTTAHDRMASLLLTPGLYTVRDLRLQYVLPRVTPIAVTPDHSQVSSSSESSD